MKIVISYRFLDAESENDNKNQGVGAGAGARGRSHGAGHFCRSWSSHLNSGGAGATLL